MDHQITPAARACAEPVVAIETLRSARNPNLLLVVLTTRDGLSGLGDAFFGAAAVEAHIHDVIAPVLLGMEDPAPERVSQLLAPYIGYQGSGVETRANGAIDLALWDLLGKRAAMPVAGLLGGPVRDSARVYNTCAGPGYVSRSTRQESANWGIGSGSQYEDLEAFLTRPGHLARELVAEGITAMKIWPFDRAAERTGGTDLTARELAEGIAVVDSIRDAVGQDLDIMIELHGLWDRRSAAMLCQALAPYRPFWVEDPLRADAADGLAALRKDIDVPVAAGETCVGRRGFLPLLSRAALDIVTVDLHWTGGLTEARKIASLADAFAVPVAPHDCTGPVSLAASVHFVLSQPNGLVQETVRAFLRTWYPTFVTGLPAVTGGRIEAPAGPGLGIELVPGLREQAGVTTRASRWEPGTHDSRTGQNAAERG